MIAALQLQQIILERTESLRQYALKPKANDFYIDKENDLLEQLTQIYEGLGSSLTHYALWEEVEEAWNTYQNSDIDFSGFILEVRVKPFGNLYLLPLNFYEHGI
jgi:hypothetical protein